MRPLPALLALAFVAAPLLAPTSTAWLPVCKIWEESAAGVTVHVEPDCDHTVWVEVCPPPPATRPCGRLYVLP